MSARGVRGRAAAGSFLLMLAPLLLLLLLLRVAPMAGTLVLSFTDATLTGGGDGWSFIGLDNYTRLFTTGDFMSSTGVTASIVIPAVIMEMVIGVLLGYWLHGLRRARRFAQAMAMLPYLLVPVVIGNLFRILFNSELGQINYVLGLFGIADQAWLTQPGLVQWTIILTEVWHTTPFVALITMAGLAGLSHDVLEAARMDGAGAVSIFWRITLPQIMPLLAVVLVLRTMDAIQLFDEVYVLTRGGPGRMTTVWNLFFYETGFRTFDLGRAAAAVSTVVVAIVVVALGVYVLRALTIRSARIQEGLR